MRTLTFLTLLTFFISCNTEHESYKSKPKPESELYKEAAEMKGLGNFIIGKTIINDLVDINKQISNDDKYSFLEQDGFIEKESWRDCPDIKQYSTSRFYIGDIEIQYIDLHFYKDTLFEITCWTSVDIRDAFTIKYGEGVKNNLRRVSGPKDNRTVENHENIVWENESIITIYDEEINSYGKKINYKNDFKISTKSTRILANIRKCIDLEFEKNKKAEESKRQENLNKL